MRKNFYKITNMDKKQTKMMTPQEESIRNVFRKMLEDKRAVQLHIQKHGTLNGFKNDSIVFAKPL